MGIQYTPIHSKGSRNLENRYKNLHIYLYPNTSTSDVVVEDGNTAHDGAKSLVNQLVEETDLEYGEVPVNYSHPDISVQAAEDMKADFGDWLDNQGVTWKGMHLLVSSGSADGYADVPGGTSSCALKDRCHGALRMGPTPQWAKNAVAHECLHSIIDPTTNTTVAWTRSHSKNGDRQHDLGTVYGSAGDISPMATSYSDHAKHGECGTNYINIPGVYNQDLTSCTTGAVQATIDKIEQ
ncbi:hypothetical protein [Halobacterium salinarum]|uniref:hypothetical protein n=1 Tax=Halobacterium salinarum TaxID=2242 RepID=UPI001F24181D|nr:hypothetical protein [Halobacterium salinarum]MCF2166529.1 hypothetical protein [Halobacterium salinarum]MCF2169046.1 hypothetical protein [Halobacterium salinarum]